jgi:hypothetical protein
MVDFDAIMADLIAIRIYYFLKNWTVNCSGEHYIEGLCSLGSLCHSFAGNS